MPIVINEIEISVEVNNASTNNNESGGGSASSLNQQQIIRECVEKVLEIMNLKQER